MPADSKIVRAMILRIADFFRYMSDNKERRLYYVIPIQQASPYAYQHSTIRDIATICDILDLVQFFKKREMTLAPHTLTLFEEVIGNTLQAYCNLYQRDKIPNFPEGNIGDLGFFLLALEKSCKIYFALLPNHWETIKLQLINLLLERQHADGSMSIFFDHRLKKYEKSSEAFYLPETLIGLIASMGNNSKELDDQIIAHVQKAIAYCCQDKNREQHLATGSATFYANWQFQLLYQWIHKKPKDQKAASLEANHLEKLINAIKHSKISQSFESNVATVEVACYLEGLVHAQHTLNLLQMSIKLDDEWFEKEINRCIQFLYELQMENLYAIKGGFVHSRYSQEARIDVAGHVFNGLCLLSNDKSWLKG
jgi:hypothetical protein